MCVMQERQLFKQEPIFQPNTNSTFKHPSSRTSTKRTPLVRSQATRKLYFSGEKKKIFESQIRDVVTRSLEKDRGHAKIRMRQMPQEDIEDSGISQRKRFILHRATRQAFCLKIKPLNLSAINSITRVILIDWLSQVTQELSISKEALHNAIFCLDKLTKRIVISKQQYQYYGLTCLFISHKLDARRVLSYSMASDLVERSISQQAFEEYEIKILKLLSFKVNPFTLWNEMTMVLEGCKYFMGQEKLQNWKHIQNKALWTIQGYIMSHSYISNKVTREKVCLYILSHITSSIVVQQSTQARLATFFKTLSPDYNQQRAYTLDDKDVGKLLNLYCDHFGSRDAHHHQLKSIALS